MNKRLILLFDLLILLIITIPTFTSILNNQYFTIHDNQHVVRLHLLDQGIKQGYLYPRWVDQLTFGFGDPLFNFYPPLVYFLAEIFHLIGFSLIWSVKLVFILGFLTASLSMYFLAKEYLGRLAGILSATVYSYFFYHGVNAYVRGALAEFFAMSILPLVFLSLFKLFKNINFKNSLFFGLCLALIILTHQLIALPLVFFLFFYFFYYLLQCVNRLKLIKYLSIGSLFGLGISAFYWLPLLVEKNYTFLNQELGDYKLHYVDPAQFWYSPWGFGASVAGVGDGMTFQLGKITLLLILISLFSFFIYLFLNKKKSKDKLLISQFIFLLFLLFFGLWMTTEYSSLIWNNLGLLWNLQFPWRFLAITAVFTALVASYWLVFLDRLLGSLAKKKIVLSLLTLFFTCFLIIKYFPHFKPQYFLNVKDKDLITKDQITWEQSKTVLHFIPKGVRSKKNEYGVWVLDIDKKDLPQKLFEVKSGEADVKILENKFENKLFSINAKTAVVFQLNTFNFSGWTAYLDSKKIEIKDDNIYKLINVSIPKGSHQLKFIFENTLVRKIGNSLSFLSFFIIILFGKKLLKK